MPVGHDTKLLELIEHIVHSAASAIAVPVMTEIGNAWQLAWPGLPRQPL